MDLNVVLEVLRRMKHNDAKFIRRDLVVGVGWES
jgi:hypothetical protein